MAAMTKPAALMTKMATEPSISPKAAQILGAAKGAFVRDGYEPTSMDTVAKEAGVSKATLYAHFTSKENLFAAVVARECQRHVETLERIEQAKLPVAEALEQIGMGFLNFLLMPDVIAVHNMVIGAANRFPALGKAFYEAGPTKVHALISEFLARATERGELAIPDPEIAAELFLAMMKGHAQLRSELGFGAPSEAEKMRTVKAGVTLFVRGYAPHS